MRIACLTTDLLSEKAICAWEDYRRAAVQLIQRTNRALITLDAYQTANEPERPTEARDLLVASQEAWEAYREAACKLESHLFYGGDGASLAFASCLKRLTEQRNQDLRIILQED